MIIWKTCEATNCRKEFYRFQESLDIALCDDCLEALCRLNALNFGAHPTMPEDEYSKLVEEFEKDPDDIE